MQIGIPVGTLYAWHVRGQGPQAVKIGRHLRYSRDEINHWVKVQVATQQKAR